METGLSEQMVHAFTALRMYIVNFFYLVTFLLQSVCGNDMNNSTGKRLAQTCTTNSPDFFHSINVSENSRDAGALQGAKIHTMNKTNGSLFL